MKTLLLFRHSLKDGPDNTVGSKGYQLAFNQGRVEKQAHAKLADAATNGERARVQRRFTKLFLGPQPQNHDTARGYCDGLGYTPEIVLIPTGLGDDALFAQINTPEFQAAVADGLTLFNALIKAHDYERFSIWADQAHTTLMGMFKAMADGEVAIGFFYGIPIMLAASACDTKTSGVIGWDNLKEMEGLVFVQHRTDDTTPEVSAKICVHTDADQTSAKTGKTAATMHSCGEGVIFVPDEEAQTLSAVGK